ncbi:hypothetical protein VOLCADRAFT_100251 [Volvox carteri f. nagariensis]|uniref:Pherophorin domain-containing protein n=1 Tax=Volvox carteri f. nagariensis TaxID=3068 RepID=D8UJU0_VOLCA|nr:uncharacterized protein VOLCADRAFT_100251 [Volvox carteri f. nagariensis]EFJ40012.1 hypothetical protein VOLCADRAFT_100251 [Volvox carteri f. nagariensis]|eukprot:XP_002958932.1 hypothetical protein VOLCADRAFT_100251 [Volvox carteri f. nagariensis]
MTTENYRSVDSFIVIGSPPCGHRGSAWSGFRNTADFILYRGAEITIGADVPVTFRASDTGSVRISQSVISAIDYSIDVGSWYTGPMADLFYNNTVGSNVVSYFRTLPNLEFQRRFNGTPGCSPLSMDEMKTSLSSYSYNIPSGSRSSFAIYSALSRAYQTGADFSGLANCVPFPFYLFGLLRTANASFAPIDGAAGIWLSDKWVTAASVTHAINVTTLTAGASASCIKTPKPAITHCIKTTIPSLQPPCHLHSNNLPPSPPGPPGGNSILANDFPFLDCKGSTTTSPYRMSSLSGPFNVTSLTATYCFTAAVSSSPVPGSSCTSTTIDKIAFILVLPPKKQRTHILHGGTGDTDIVTNSVIFLRNIFRIRNKKMFVVLKVKNK